MRLRRLCGDRKKIVNVKFPTIALATPWETSGMEKVVSISDVAVSGP
jgi:hypothetical protein